MSRFGTVALASVGLAVGVIGVRALSDATLSTHHPVPRGSTIELIVDAEENRAEHTQAIPELVEAQVQTCRLTVNSDLLGEVEQVGGHRYRAVLSPSMDESNRRQFRGCLEDWVIDHVRLDVLRLTPR